MDLVKLSCLLTILVLFGSCNEEVKEEEPGETCVEGWEPIENDNEIYYNKCPSRISDCVVYLKIGLDVGRSWTDGPGVLIIRNIENGVTEEIRKEQQLYSHRFQIKMSYDRSHQYVHEVTLELPTDKCKINGEFFSYTYEFDVPCDTFVDAAFHICPD